MRTITAAIVTAADIVRAVAWAAAYILWAVFAVPVATAGEVETLPVRVAIVLTTVAIAGIAVAGTWWARRLQGRQR